MRLRRETGDFQIVVNTTAGTVNTIRKGLGAEDLAGELVKVGAAYEPVTSATDGDGVVTLKTESYILTYTKSTGAITAEQNSGGGSGSGGSGPLVIEGNYLYMDPPDAMVCVFPEPIATGLTIDDFAGVVVKLNQCWNSSEEPDYVTICIGLVASVPDDVMQGGFASGTMPIGDEIMILLAEGATAQPNQPVLVYIPSTGMIYDNGMVPLYEEDLSAD